MMNCDFYRQVCDRFKFTDHTLVFGNATKTVIICSLCKTTIAYQLHDGKFGSFILQPCLEKFFLDLDLQV
jgi:hypothetical protein